MTPENLKWDDFNCILEIPLIPMNLRFLTLIDNFGSPPDDRYDLEICNSDEKQNPRIS
jgi:hypothetical protein